MDLTLYIFDLIGTFAFAISGILSTVNKKIDLFGAYIIAFVTALGGGTIRDLLLGKKPLVWIQDTNYIFLVGVAVFMSFFFKERIVKFRKLMFIFDGIGLSVFTIIGVQNTLDIGLSPVVAIMMGTISAVFGGVLRDILCNDIPLILQREIYASACIVGACLYLILNLFISNDLFVICLTTVSIIIIRMLAVTLHLSLPKLK